MADDEDGDGRFERLIAATEAQTNAINRLVQVLSKKHASNDQSRRTRMRRTVTAERPIAVTPMVEAAVERALKRVGK